MIRFYLHFRRRNRTRRDALKMARWAHKRGKRLQPQRRVTLP